MGPQKLGSSLQNAAECGSEGERNIDQDISSDATEKICNAEGSKKLNSKEEGNKFQEDATANSILSTEPLPRVFLGTRTNECTTPEAHVESINDRLHSVSKIEAHLFKLKEIECNLMEKDSATKAIFNEQSAQR